MGYSFEKTSIYFHFGLKVLGQSVRYLNSSDDCAIRMAYLETRAFGKQNSRTFSIPTMQENLQNSKGISWKKEIRIKRGWLCWVRSVPVHKCVYVMWNTVDLRCQKQARLLQDRSRHSRLSFPSPVFSKWRVWLITRQIKPLPAQSDEYAYRIPNPVGNLSRPTPKVKVRVPKLLPLPYKTLATTGRPEYVATHSRQPDYLAPLRTWQKPKLQHFSLDPLTKILDRLSPFQSLPSNSTFGSGCVFTTTGASVLGFRVSGVLKGAGSQSVVSVC